MPLGESMITTLRNNKSQRLSKDRKLRNTDWANSSKTETFSFDQQTASKEDLVQIRQRMEAKGKRKLVRFLIVFIFLAVVAFIMAPRMVSYFFY
ncbi:MAG: hypothetical protein ACI828_002312 [Flavobacteriales bacterium]|jgi:hypothetical protein